ncbi:MAG: hypothetical protein MUF58_05020 [Arcicella sp.]|jgi:hypothetical protein|nr:hypothetical protein [Arcicella sp.]
MTANIKRKSFDDWTTQEVRLAFHLKETDSSELLTEWLSVVHPLDDYQKIFLQEKRELLKRFYRSWNEDELKFQFIAHIVEMARLRGDNFGTFSQRKLSATINDITLYGRPEVMIATGQEDPLKPYFFIHEYKPSKRADEPLGQVLSAMVAAQYLNEDNRPLLGCFVLGSIWQFVVLENKTYTLSDNYDATQFDELSAIYSALCQAKVYIQEQAGELMID